MAVSGLTFNQFQVELKKRGIEGQQAIIFTMIYEQLREVVEQQEQAMGLMLGMAQTMENFVQLSEHQQERMVELRKRITGEEDGVSLASMPLLDEPKN